MKIRPSIIPRPWKKHRVDVGTAPGTIAVDPNAARPVVQVVAFGPDGYEEAALDDLGKIDALRRKWPTVWVHVEGLGDEGVFRRLQETFGLHELALEDVITQNQRPKLESYDGHDYLVLIDATKDPLLQMHQVNLFLGKGFVFTIVDKPSAWDEPVRKRIREGRTLILKRGTGYLAYALMDAVVDHFYPIIDDFTGHMISLEADALSNPGRDDIAHIHAVANDLMALRRVLLPLRDMTKYLSQEQHPLIDRETRVYFRDCHDHVAELLDEIDTGRELSRSLVDTCLGTMSHRMNEIMKVLTIIATIFIPLGFIAGVYGMNFDNESSPLNMPELSWYFGYPFALLLMLGTAVGLLFFFRLKGWLGSQKKHLPK